MSMLVPTRQGYPFTCPSSLVSTPRHSTCLWKSTEAYGLSSELAYSYPSVAGPSSWKAAVWRGF